MRRAEACRVDGGSATLELDLQGISCVGCVWLIERLFRDREGAHGIRVNATLGRVSLTWEPEVFRVVDFAQELQRFGYLVGPATKMRRTESSGLVLRLGLCAAFALNAMLFALPPYLGMEPDFPFAKLFTFLSFVFASASVLVGGTYFFGRSWKALRRGVVHIDLPISLGILAGYAGSIYAWTQAAGDFVYFDFVSTFSFLMIVGRWTQLAAVERNRNRLLGMNQDLPAVELVDDETADDEENASANPAEWQRSHREVATKSAVSLELGDRFFVEPGQVVPVSSTLLATAASIGLDWISGESDARVALPGQVVESGAINLSSHRIRLRALEAWGSSLLSRLFAVQAPSERRNQTLETIIRTYLIAVLGVAVVGGAFWLWRSRDLSLALQVVVSVLVVSCPCALGVTLPLIDEMAVARLRSSGVFVRAEDLWSRLRRVRKVIFDKTGTLTLESLVLRNPKELRRLDGEARIALGVLVHASRHPVASCIREALMASGTDAASDSIVHASSNVYEKVGYGLEWTHSSGTVWRLGRASWATGGAPESAPGTDAVCSRDGEIVATFQTGEEIREDAVEEVDRMRKRGMAVFILSGDREEKVQVMAKRLGLSPAAAVGAMSPEGKAAWVAFDRSRRCASWWATGPTTPWPSRRRRVVELPRWSVGCSSIDPISISAAGCVESTTCWKQPPGASARWRRCSASRSSITWRRSGLPSPGGWSPLLAAVLMPLSALASLAIAAIGMRQA